jgi:hypothetical protein
MKKILNNEIDKKQTMIKAKKCSVGNKANTIKFEVGVSIELNILYQ